MSILFSFPSMLIGVQGCLLHRTSLYEELDEPKQRLVGVHGRAIMRAVLCGFAGVAPRSTTPNLIELLSALLTRFPDLCRVWIPEVLYAVRTHRRSCLSRRLRV
jgi:hypothetical protein